jgi:hypothetical protein
MIEYHRHISGISDAGLLIQTPHISQVMSIDDWRFETERDFTIVQQYIGSLESIFFKHIAKEH